MYICQPGKNVGERTRTALPGGGAARRAGQKAAAAIVQIRRDMFAPIEVCIFILKFPTSEKRRAGG
ncbi:MAG: hypothetical protein AMXMBFR13_08500 [Phycisphaerae bacterium]